MSGCDARLTHSLKGTKTINHRLLGARTRARGRAAAVLRLKRADSALDAAKAGAMAAQASSSRSVGESSLNRGRVASLKRKKANRLVPMSAIASVGLRAGLKQKI